MSLPYVAAGTEHGRLQATLGAWSTVAWLAVVNVFWVAAELLVGEAQLSAVDLLLFDSGALAVIGWFGLLASSEKTDALLSHLANATQTVAAERNLMDTAVREASPGRYSRTATNLWIPVTFQFVLAGWLLYASGGPFSPFVMVPGAMVFIGQCVHHIPSIELCDRPRARDLLVFTWRVIRFYAYPQLISASLLVVVALLQIYHPLRTRPVPIAETMCATQLTLSIGLCVGFVARRSDRTGASRAS